jgi:hypothetical protein
VYDTIYSHSNVIIENSLSVGSNVTLSSQLSVYDTIYSHSNVIIENSLSVGSNVTLSSQLSVYDTIYSHSNVVIGSTLSIGDTLYTNAIIGSTLSINSIIYGTINDNYNHTNIFPLFPSQRPVSQFFSTESRYAKVDRQLTIGNERQFDINEQNDLQKHGNTLAGLVIDNEYLDHDGDEIEYDYSIYTYGDIRVNNTVYASDKRIKENIMSLDTIEITDKFMKLKVQKYNKIDKPGIEDIGLIAQDVKTLFPECVSENIDYIPNIKKNVKCVATDTFDFDENIEIYELIVGDVIKIKCQQYTYHTTVKEILDTGIKVEDTFTINEIYFIYGKLVNDLMSINYNKLFCYMLHVFQETTKNQ